MDIIVLLRSLFCALAVTLPGALGRTTWLSDQKPMPPKKILLNTNVQLLVNAVNELRSIFTDLGCLNCTSCMERAIKVHLNHTHVLYNQPEDHAYYYDVQNSKRSRRAAPDAPLTYVKGKTVTASVTKYTKDKKVVAIEVKQAGKNTCKVYSVRKSMPCDSACDSLCALNKKLNKGKKVDTTVATTQTAKSMTPGYRKREADNFQASESFMPSIEELY